MRPKVTFWSYRKEAIAHVGRQSLSKLSKIGVAVISGGVGCTFYYFRDDNSKMERAIESLIVGTTAAIIVWLLGFVWGLLMRPHQHAQELIDRNCELESRIEAYQSPQKQKKQLLAELISKLEPASRQIIGEFQRTGSVSFTRESLRGLICLIFKDGQALNFENRLSVDKAIQQLIEFGMLLDEGGVHKRTALLLELLGKLEETNINSPASQFPATTKHDC